MRSIYKSFIRQNQWDPQTQEKFSLKQYSEFIDTDRNKETVKSSSAPNKSTVESLCLSFRKSEVPVWHLEKDYNRIFEIKMSSWHNQLEKFLQKAVATMEHAECGRLHRTHTVCSTIKRVFMLWISSYTIMVNRRLSLHQSLSGS